MAPLPITPTSPPRLLVTRAFTERSYKITVGVAIATSIIIVLIIALLVVLGKFKRQDRKRKAKQNHTSVTPARPSQSYVAIPEPTVSPRASPERNAPEARGVTVRDSAKSSGAKSGGNLRTIPEESPAAAIFEPRDIADGHAILAGIDGVGLHEHALDVQGEVFEMNATTVSKA